MVFWKNFGDPGHSGLSVGLSGKEAELTLYVNSSAGNGSRHSRSESTGSFGPHD